tara:strand:+ start:65 stop:229 length:165 start_codon:yes stop_codon:yes gene_type:complete
LKVSNENICIELHFLSKQDFQICRACKSTAKGAEEAEEESKELRSNKSYINQVR